MRNSLYLKQLILQSRTLSNTDGDGGGGGGAGAAPAPANDPAAAFQRLLDKFNNNSNELAAKLFDENYQYRTTIRQLEGKQPKDGTLVLSPEEAKDYKKIKDLLSANELDPKSLKETLEKVPTLEKTARELGAMESLRDLADIGLDGQKLKVSVLKDLVHSKYPDAEFRFVTEKDKDGNEVRTAYIKPAKDGQETTFSEFAGQNLSDYLPALKVTAEQLPPPTGNTKDPQPAGAATGFFDRIREQVKSQNEEAAKQTVNPLARFGRVESAQ